ncbi:MAG: 50S ribosomal protein L10 [Ignavibacteria bacterium]|nr:50S ribosomal protein L10 [Ignavibacteria bacterium]
MEKKKKIETTGEIASLMDSTEALYLTDFTGMTVEEVNELRDEFFKSNIKYKVVKNTLALRAVQKSKNFSDYNEKISEFLKGPTGIIFSDEDPIAPAKILKKFFNKSEKPKLKLAIVEKEVYESDKLNALASLLSKDELIAGIVFCLNSPVSGIVGSINAVIRDLASVIEEVAKKNAA